MLLAPMMVYLSRSPHREGKFCFTSLLAIIERILSKHKTLSTGKAIELGASIAALTARVTGAAHPTVKVVALFTGEAVAVGARAARETGVEAGSTHQGGLAFKKPLRAGGEAGLFVQNESCGTLSAVVTGATITF